MVGTEGRIQLQYSLLVNDIVRGNWPVGTGMRDLNTPKSLGITVLRGSSRDLEISGPTSSEIPLEGTAEIAATMDLGRLTTEKER